jgi:uncharacterized protein YoaH (UPF0181 family)
MTYYKVWSTALDGRECPLCAKMEGAAVKSKEHFHILGHPIKNPPIHDGCRCTVLLIEEADLKPQSIRDYNAYSAYSNIANTSTIFYNSVNGYFSSLYFLEKLASYSIQELNAVGLSSPNVFLIQSQKLRERQNQIVNKAIKRSYDETVFEAKSLKTERGRKARVNTFVQEILSENIITSVNCEYLRQLTI